MATPIKVGTNFPLTMSYLNQYLGAPSNKTRSYSGVEQQPVNFSINQIFNSRVNTTVPLIGTFSASSLNGKTFGMYTSSSRNFIHGSSFSGDLIPAFTGYFGFGTSGILNSTNRGCPIRIGITSNGRIIARTLKGSTWSNFTTNQFNQTTYDIDEFDAISIFSNDIGRVSVTLQASPSLEGSVAGLGIHTINIVFPQDDRSDIIGPPIKDEIDPPPLPPGDGVLGGGLDQGLDNIR